MTYFYSTDLKKKKIVILIVLLVLILIVGGLFWFLKNENKYDAYNTYNKDNKKIGEVMHYNDDNDELYVSLYYPKTESKKLNNLVDNYYKSYLKEQKSTNNKEIIYMDYAINEQFDQFINLTLTINRYDENDIVKNTNKKIFAYDLKNEKILTVSDCLRRNYKNALTNITGIDKIESNNTNIEVGKKSFTIYTDDKLKNKVEINYEENKDLIRLANKNIPSNAPLNVKEPAPQPEIDPNKKMIAITLDDGPHKTNTLRTIELFEKYNGRATFFMLGKNVKLYPETVKTVYEHGFEIGSHSWDHPDLRKLDAAGVSKQITDTQNEIFKITGFDPAIIRPPYGATNDVSKQVIANNNMKIALWNLDSEDWKLKDANKIRDVIVNKAFDGAVILIHDIHTFTIDGLEMALQQLSDNGYQFVTLDTLMQYKQLKSVIR